MKFISKVVFFLLVLTSTLLASSEITRINGDNIFIELSYTHHQNSNHKIDENFMVLDYEGNEVAVVKLVEIIKLNEEKYEYRLKLISGESNIKPGFLIKEYNEILLISLIAEYSKIELEPKVNENYVALTSETPALKTSGTVLSLGAYLTSNRNRIICGGLSTTFMELGPVDMWELIGLDLGIQPEIIHDKFYMGLSGNVGIGFGFGNIKWARPEGNYDDSLLVNSGEAKLDAQGFIYSYRLSGTVTINFIRQLGLQLKVSYLKFFNLGYVDNTIPENGDHKYYEIRDEWLEQDLDNAGVTVGFGLVYNLIDKK